MGNAMIKCVGCFEVPDTKPDKDTLDIIATQMEQYLSKNPETSETQHGQNNILKK